MPMMKIGSHRLPDFDGDGAEIDALRDEHDRERDRQEIDREGPEHVEDARQDRVGDAAEKPATSPMAVARTECNDGGGAGDQQRIAPAIKQPRHHIAALIVGAEEIVAELPGGADRRVAEPQALGRLLHHRHLLGHRSR